MTTEPETPDEDAGDFLNLFDLQIEGIFNDIVDKIDRAESNDLRSLMAALYLNDLDSEDLSGSDLSHQDLSGLRFRYVRFVGADCRNTDFRSSDLSHADFTDALMDGAKLEGARLIGVTGLEDPNKVSNHDVSRPCRVYEHTFLTRPDLGLAEVNALAEQAADIVEESGGRVVKVENWGLRSLAYRIAKNPKAHYVFLEIDAPPSAVTELERRILINEDIIRHLTVRVDGIEEGPSVMARKGKSKANAESSTDQSHHYKYKTDYLEAAE